MPKKVSELTKELDITLQELKDYAVKMGIEVGGARSSIDDADAARLVTACIHVAEILNDASFGKGDSEGIHGMMAMVVALCPILDVPDNISILVEICFCQT